jgi:WD40 repeat protein
MSGDRIASCANDKTICVFNTKDLRDVIERLKTGVRPAVNLAEAPNGNIVYSPDWGRVSMVDHDGAVTDSGKSDSRNRDLCVLPGGLIVLFRNDGVSSTIGVYDMSREFAPVIERVYGDIAPEDIVSCVALPDGNMATGTDKGKLYIWDSKTLHHMFRANLYICIKLDSIVVIPAGKNSADSNYKLAVCNASGLIYIYE